jgi:hypothetical protein
MTLERIKNTGTVLEDRASDLELCLKGANQNYRNVILIDYPIC